MCLPFLRNNINRLELSTNLPLSAILRFFNFEIKLQSLIVKKILTLIEGSFSWEEKKLLTRASQPIPKKVSRRVRMLPKLRGQRLVSQYNLLARGSEFPSVPQRTPGEPLRRRDRFQPRIDPLPKGTGGLCPIPVMRRLLLSNRRPKLLPNTNLMVKKWSCHPIS